VGTVAGLLLAALLVGCGSSATDSGSQPTPTPTPTPTSGPPAPPTAASTLGVIRGADISWLTQMQTVGYSWQDETGTQMSALQILQNHGVSAVRIRTFVNPAISSSALGVGDTDQAGSVALAQMANKLGMQVMIDFHYSDTWADPSHQAVPAAWANDSYTQMQSDLYNYTYNFMTALLAAGVTPAWVQVGNEIDSGMLLPTGSTSNMTQLVGLINQGYQAVKKASPTTQVIIHHSGLSNLTNLEWFYDNLTTNGAQFDILGFSYYDGPDTLTTSAANLATMASRYSKPVMICEIGHTVSDTMGSEYDVKSAIEALAAVPNQAGLGLFYWEPEAPDDAITSNYSMGSVTETSGMHLQFTGAIDQFLFTGGTSGNQILNSGFNAGINGWQLTASSSGVFTTQPGGNGTEFVLSPAAAYTASISQDQVSLPDGSYTLTAWIESSGGQNSATLYAQPVGGSKMSAGLPTANAWTQVQIANVRVIEGEATIGISVDANAGNWIRVESVSFTKN
jgi:arabinogalactan endo-1,4-beta-galactosidase